MPPWPRRQPRFEDRKSALTMTVSTTAPSEQGMAPTTTKVDQQEELPLKEVNLDLSFALNDQTIDLNKVEAQRRSNNQEKNQHEHHDWNMRSTSEIDIEQEEKLAESQSDLSQEAKDVLKAAACLGSFDTRLLQAAMSLSVGDLDTILAIMAERGIVERNESGEYEFSSDETEKECYALIPPEERRRLHLSIGRRLIRELSHDELEKHIYPVLLQFHCAMNNIGSETERDALTNQRERNGIALLCLQATHSAVAGSNFRAAFNYSEFGILLLGDDCWDKEYDLSLALYNAAAEISHCVAEYEKVEEAVDAVLENAHSFRDTLRARAARVHSLSSRYRLTEALKEGLDILGHLGERFPSKPRKYHAFLAFVNVKRLLRGKTNEKILRMPLMENQDKIAAMQILNLIFPNAFHVDPILFVLFALRLVQLTARFGLSAMSAVGFAAYSSMLASFHTDKSEGFRFSELALELIGKFGAKEYIARVHFFLYSETMTHRYDLRTLTTHLYRAYQVGMETGDVEFALVDSNLCFSYMLLSGQSLATVETRTREFYDTALEYKQDLTLGTMRPALKCLHMLMGKLPIPTGFAFQSDLDRAVEAKDEAAIWIIHFLQLMLSYMLNDYEAAARETQFMGPMLQLHLHPGFSSILVAYCMALLAVANKRQGRERRKLLSNVYRNVRKLKQFSTYIPENSLHKLSLVEAELAVVNGDYGVARGK